MRVVMWFRSSANRLDPITHPSSARTLLILHVAFGWKDDMWRQSHGNQAAFDGHSGWTIQSDGQTTGMIRTLFLRWRCRPIAPRQRDRFDRN
jgi:hypothetical protein